MDCVTCPLRDAIFSLKSPQAVLIADILKHEPIAEANLCLALQKAAACNCEPASWSVLAKLIMSNDEIKQKWRKEADIASAKGTLTHLQCEVVLNGGLVVGRWPELDLLEGF